MTNKKCLVAYFSHRGENYVSGKIMDLKVGNTEIIAQMIADYLDGDLFHIQKTEQYPFEYRSTVDVAKKEYQENARPKLVNEIQDFAKYDVVFVGFPNWCGTMPMPVWTFLESYDFSNKILVPFCTHEGSGLGRSESDIKKLCPQADLMPGKAFFGHSVNDAKTEVEKWLDDILC